MKHTNEFLSTLASNNVDDLPAIYHTLVCDYGEDMYDSYELEQYVNWKNNAVLNIQQYNVLFRKYLHEKRVFIHKGTQIANHLDSNIIDKYVINQCFKLFFEVFDDVNVEVNS